MKYNNTHLHFILVLFFLLAATGLFCQVIEQGSRVVSLRSSALGGFHPGLADDTDVLFSNPAGFRGAGNHLHFARAVLGLHGPVFELAGYVSGSADDDDLVSILDPEDYSGLLHGAVTFKGPLAFSFVRGGIAFGAFSQSGVFLNSESTVEIAATLQEELLLIGGYSFSLPLPGERNTLDLGVSLKGFFRAESGFDTSILATEFVIDDVINNRMGEQEFGILSGIGIDLGIRYAYSDSFAFGLSVMDVYSPTVRTSYAKLDDFFSGDSSGTTRETGIVPLKLNAGLFWRPPLGRIGLYVSDLIFMASYSDILGFLMYADSARYPLLNIGAGAELLLLDILSLRAGLHDGYLAAGVGIKLGFFDFGVSMYGSELSSQPGLRPLYNVLIGFGIAR